MRRRTILLQLVLDDKHDKMVGVIPSSYDLCRMYDDGAVQLKVVSKDGRLQLRDYRVYLKFVSGHVDLGEVLIEPDGPDYTYIINQYYTTNNLLEVLVELREVQTDTYLCHTNSVQFKLSKSYPPTSVFNQNLSYLNRLVHDGRIVLEEDKEEQELVIFDDMENELCRIDISDYIGGDE
jgi:hypothetical protein